MEIVTLTIHNFRSIADVVLNLGSYTLLVGANNSGKSNAMDALRVFYEKGLKYDQAHDFPKFQVGDKESWIDIEFVLTDGEYASLKDEYRRPGNRMKVRKYMQTESTGADGKVRQGIYAYVGDQVSDQRFYGAKNVQEGKLGEIIFIPAASRLDDHTKLTGPSALRDLLGDILKKLVKSSAAFRTLTEGLDAFGAQLKTEETEDRKSLSGLEQDINAGLAEWGAEFQLSISPMGEADVLKNLISYQVRDTELNDSLEASQFGQGFQRHLIFTLIRTAAKYQAVPISSTTKDFTPNMTLLLFEEPEAFLHPGQQDVLCRSLRDITSHEGNQVLASSHSPHFVCHSTDALPSIARLCREHARTMVGQLNQETLSQVFAENQRINALLQGTKFEAGIDDLTEDMEAIKYFLWLDSQRSGLFFVRHVLLVEGPTERVLVNYLTDNGQLTAPAGGLFVMDCMCKFNIHRFMNLLGRLRIPHSVLYDADSRKPPHDVISKLIEGSKNAYTYGVYAFPDDIEAFLGIDKVRERSRKPQHVLFRLKEGKVPEERLDAFINIVLSLVQVRQA